MRLTMQGIGDTQSDISLKTVKNLCVKADSHWSYEHVDEKSWRIHIEYFSESERPCPLRLKDMTAAELQALTEEQCFAMLSDYSMEEIDGLRHAYIDEWIWLVEHLGDRCIPTRELRNEARERLAEIHKRKAIVGDFHWWKTKNASFDDIQATFEERRKAAEAERQEQEMWKARDAARDEAWHFFHDLAMKHDKELYE